ncbi:unnamed protein product [Pleuronectes platessa]|uniref:Uncharacterized protein n=1 Tax=Pleuronectes platessa TaxID=8262 RepID=A0A9N7VAW3_PLEPL|nr:unnamed protein product [Pleuronectes platessa]
MLGHEVSGPRPVLQSTSELSLSARDNILGEEAFWCPFLVRPITFERTLGCLQSVAPDDAFYQNPTKPERRPAAPDPNLKAILFFVSEPEQSPVFSPKHGKNQRVDQPT